MLDILLYSEDTKLSQLISSYLLEQNKHFRILHVLSEEADLITFLQKSHFDFLILVTEREENSHIFDYLNKFNIENHLNSIIVVSGNAELKKILRKSRFLAKSFNKNTNPQTLAKQISNVIEEKYAYNKNIKARIIHELYYIGFKPYHKGTGFMAESIYMVYQKDAHLCDNFEKNIYPMVAAKYNTTTTNVKSDIIKSINSMYAECELSKLQKYFHFSTDFRPTTKMIIYTVISNIAQN